MNQDTSDNEDKDFVIISKSDVSADSPPRSVEEIAVHDSLLSLPTSLEDMYSQMLDDHAQLASTPRERQLLILQLVTHATRPLRLLEIATVLDFLDMNKGNHKYRDTKNLARMSCGPLLEILDDETVSIIHHSFTQFLTESRQKEYQRGSDPFPVIDSVETNELMALISIKYILSGCLSSWNFSTGDESIAQMRNLQLQYPFLEYAINNWYVHVRRLPDVKRELLKQLDTFVNTANDILWAWIDVVMRPSCPLKFISPLHVSAWGGMTSYTRELLRSGHDCNVLDGEQRTPLTTASTKGNLDIVNLLLRHGAAPDNPDQYGLKPLHYAARMGHFAVVQAPLDAGVSPMTDINLQISPGRHKETPSKTPSSRALHIVAAGTHWWQTDALNYLLQRGADVELRDYVGKTPLHTAIAGGYRRVGIIRALLKHGANPNGLDGKGMTPLNLAFGDLEVVRLLIQHGADIALGSKPILFAAIQNQDVDTVRIILETGFDCNKPFKEAGEEDVARLMEMDDTELDFLLMRPIHYASHSRLNHVVERHKVIAIVELLLAHGASPFLPYDDNTTVLHDVINVEGLVGPFLTLAGLDMEQCDGRGRTLFLAACEKRELKWGVLIRPAPPLPRQNVIRKLREMGANISAVDNQGNNGLHLLVAGGIPNPINSDWKELLSFLLDKCPTLLHQPNIQGFKPFQLATESLRLDLLPVLMDAGADHLEPDPNGNTLLHHLALTFEKAWKNDFNSFRKILKSDAWPTVSHYFLDFGLDINARNNDGDTPLLKYVGSGCCLTSLRQDSDQDGNTILALFVRAGANIFLRNNAGENLLHLVAKLPCSGSHSRVAVKEKYIKSFTYLMEMGLNPLQEDEQRTAVDIAAMYQKEDILSLFQKK